MCQCFATRCAYQRVYESIKILSIACVFIDNSWLRRGNREKLHMFYVIPVFLHVNNGSLHSRFRWSKRACLIIYMIIIRGFYPVSSNLNSIVWLDSSWNDLLSEFVVGESRQDLWIVTNARVKITHTYTTSFQ